MVVGMRAGQSRRRLCRVATLRQNLLLGLRHLVDVLLWGLSLRDAGCGTLLRRPCAIWPLGRHEEGAEGTGFTASREVPAAAQSQRLPFNPHLGFAQAASVEALRTCKSSSTTHLTISRRTKWR